MFVFVQIYFIGLVQHVRHKKWAVQFKLALAHPNVVMISDCIVQQIVFVIRHFIGIPLQILVVTNIYCSISVDEIILEYFKSIKTKVQKLFNGQTCSPATGGRTCDNTQGLSCVGTTCACPSATQFFNGTACRK